MWQGCRSQTGFSVMRPSPYFGIAGFKPTYGTIATLGMKRLAPSMDTVGIHTTSINDIELIHPVLLDKFNFKKIIVKTFSDQCQYAN